MTLKIKRVDMDGYNGREHHPLREDEGKTVRVVGMEVAHIDKDSGEWVNLSESQTRDDLVTLLADAENHEQVFIAYTEDGRKLELMGHEVELVSLQ